MQLKVWRAKEPLRISTLDELHINDEEEEEDVWVDVVQESSNDLNDNTLDSLAALFHLHPLTFEDVQMREDLEKCQVFIDGPTSSLNCYMFACLRPWTAEEDAVVVIYAVLTTKKRLLTIRSHQSDELMEMIEKGPVSWIFYQILDQIVDQFVPLVEAGGLEADALDEIAQSLSHQDHGDFYRRMAVARKRLLRMQWLLKPKLEIVGRQLMMKQRNNKGPFDRQAMAGHTRDLHDHLTLLIASLTGHLETLDRAYETYCDQISVEMAKAAFLRDRMTKKFTAVTSVLLPLSLISGAFGMNIYGTVLASFLLGMSIFAVIGIGVGWLLGWI